MISDPNLLGSGGHKDSYDGSSILSTSRFIFMETLKDVIICIDGYNDDKRARAGKTYV